MQYGKLVKNEMQIKHSIVPLLIIHAIILEKPCSHPEFSSPTIANGTLEINGKRQGGLQVKNIP